MLHGLQCLHEDANAPQEECSCSERIWCCHNVSFLIGLIWVSLLLQHVKPTLKRVGRRSQILVDGTLWWGLATDMQHYHSNQA